ncbi:MAG TPA: hypothetical protein VHF02_05640 [Luteimonas sp.]|nr:hypothetical protein [Luteimonas sp.]
MTTSRTTDTARDRTATRSVPAIRVPEPPTRRDYRERDFGVGYGRSSGYASDKRYVNGWNGPTHFRCG